MYKTQEECMGTGEASCNAFLNAKRKSRLDCYESAIGSILSSLGKLSISEKAELSALEEEPLSLHKGDIINRENEPSLYLYTLDQGWAYACRASPDSSRHLLDIFVPGDIIGLREYTLKKNNTEVAMLTDGKVYPIYKESLSAAAKHHQSLADRILSLLVYQQNVVLDRLKSSIQHDATTRIIHFILELHTRFSRINKVHTLSLKLPLPQTLIGELLGMSGVHVSRCFSQLEQQGLIQRENGSIRILSYRKMIEIANFESDFLAKEIAEGGRMYVT